MLIRHALPCLLFCAAAASAAQGQPVIARPLTLPSNTFAVTLQGTYTNWAGSALVGSDSFAGETLALGLDFGATDHLQLGLGVALPINPGAGFGSLLASAAIAADENLAVRIDAGFESLGANGDNSSGPTHTSRFFGGVGAPIKVPITPTLAFVSGRSGAIELGHFNNIGQNGTGVYSGATFFSETASDFLVVSAGDQDSTTIVGVRLPLGLLVQPDPVFALTLTAGYSAVISIPKSGSTEVLHFVPVALETVVTPVASLDIGLRFSLDGYVAHSGSGGAGTLGYFDMRALMLWLRLHT